MSSPNVQNKYPEWLKKEQNEGNIVFYDYSQFKNVKDIGKGGFGLISSAYCDGTKVALKNLNTKEATREFVNEVIIKETVVEEFITNDNQKPIPILTRNGAYNLFPIGPTIQTLNEPSLRNPNQTSPDDTIESITQVQIRYE
ncbi:6862_t:CDS:2, partial [Gigaspora rosea]